jgi:hypothetical protein
LPLLKRGRKLVFLSFMNVYPQKLWRETSCLTS